MEKKEEKRKRKRRRKRKKELTFFFVKFSRFPFFKISSILALSSESVGSGASFLFLLNGCFCKELRK